MQKILIRQILLSWYLAYAWYRSGYLSERPLQFQNSIQICFNLTSDDVLSKNEYQILNKHVKISL